MKSTWKVLLSALMIVVSMPALALSLSETGSVVCLRNVGSQAYLALGANHQAMLSEAGISFSLSTPSGNGSDATNCLVITGTEGMLSAAQNTALSTNGEGKYSEWRLTPVSTNGKTYYRVACRAKESNAYAYAIFDPVSNEVMTQPVRPATTYNNGLWELLTEEQAKAVLLQVVLNDDADYAVPGSADEYTVYLHRKLSVGVMNSLCLPFALTLQKAREIWGADTKIYEPRLKNGTSITFRTVKSVEAGVPCILKPASLENTVTLPDAVTNQISSSMAVDGYYKFEGVTEMVDAPNNFVQGLEFRGNFEKIIVPAQSYVLSGGSVYHTVSDLSMKPYRGYMADIENNVVAYAFSVEDDEDDTVTALHLVEEADEEDGAIYNLQGQAVRQAGQSAAGLKKGIYVVNGKKVTIR